jgi:hypothetical protein
LVRVEFCDSDSFFENEVESDAERKMIPDGCSSSGSRRYGDHGPLRRLWGKPQRAIVPRLRIEIREPGHHMCGEGALAVQIIKATLVAAVALVAPLLCPLAGAAEESGRAALTVTIDGAIGPASASYVKEALARAAARRAEIVILKMNTPGGLNSSMREIIADVLASSVPVVGYVAPSGGHAASAGTYVLYATHIAAMAPGTNIGAATPVQIGGSFPGLPSGVSDKDGKDKKDEPKDAMTAKATNDAVAFIRSLAELHGRNADWAEKAVREAARSRRAARCRPRSSISSRAMKPTCSGRSMAAWSRSQAARCGSSPPGTPWSKPSIPDGSRDFWRSSPIPTSPSFS